MQPDHEVNLNVAASAVGESLAFAWAHFHLLRGLDNGRQKQPELVDKFEFFYDRLWRASFDSFFAKVGTLLDKNQSNHSLFSFLTLARSYASPEVRKLLPVIDVDLAKNGSPLAKLKRWRHEVVAHKPKKHEATEFHAQNKMTLTEIERALEQLSEYSNQISLNVLNLYVEPRSAFEDIVGQAEAFFAAAALGVKKNTNEA